MKLVCLLALLTGQRMQTLSLINIDNIERETDLIRIKIPDRIITSGRNRNQPVLVLPYFLENNKICAASSLDSYIQKSKNVHKSIKSLFITSEKPFISASSQS